MKMYIEASPIILFTISVLLVGSFPVKASVLFNVRTGVEPNITYRWAYANPDFVQDSETTDKHAPPISLQYTHMGMLNVLPNSSLVAAWQGAEVFWEGSKAQGIYWAVSPDSGMSWERPQLLVPASAGVPIWAPVVHVQDGTAWLFYSESRPQCWWWGEGGLHWACGGDLKQIHSSDGGLSWTDPQVVFSFDSEGGIAKMVANKIELGPNGEWLLPFWREMGGNDCTHAPDMHGRAGVLISKDQGDSWEHVDVELEESSPPTWLIEASISETSIAGEVSYVQVFRTQVGLIYRSTSKDGRKWSPAIPTPVLNPNSKVDMTELPDGTLLLAFNDDANKRTPLCLATSRDAGATWNTVAVLEDDPKGSFSYPTLQYFPSEVSAPRRVALFKHHEAKVSAAMSSSDGVVSQQRAELPGKASRIPAPQTELLSGIQKQVLVIYSVAYPPRPALMRGPEAAFAALQNLGRQALDSVRQWLLGTLTVDGIGGIGHEPLWWLKSAKQPPNAWGYDAYGLRVALLDASDLH